MRWGMSSLGVAVAAPIGAAAIAWSGVSPLPTPTELLAQSLYMRGTKAGSYTDDDGPTVAFANGLITQTTGTPGTLVVDNGDDWMTGDQVEYAGAFWPFSQGGLTDLTYGASVQQGLGRLSERVDAEGTNDTVIVYGYSQGAVILSQYKAQTTHDNVVYILAANPTRPNGGILARVSGFTIPILDIPFSGPAPTTSPGWEPGDPPTTYDVTRQYDGWADFPLYPLNPLATGNAILGVVYLHGTTETEVDPEADLGPDATNTDTRDYGDTRYYTVGTDLLPLLRPLEQVGVPRPVLLVLDAPLRVAVEQGYDRTINPGEATPARIIRIANPITDASNFLKAIPVGIDDGLEAAGYDRPLNTTPAGMYGVGGPQVNPPSESITSTNKVAPNDSSQQPQDEPAQPNRTSLADPGQQPKSGNESTDSAPAAKPERRQVQRPKVRGPIDFSRSITNTIKKSTAPDKSAADGSGTSKPNAPAVEKTAAGKRDGGILRSLAAATSDRDGGYVGKHRKADNDNSGTSSNTQTGNDAA